MTMTQSFNFYKIILRGIFYLDEHNKSSNSLDNFITLEAARQKKKKKRFKACNHFKKQIIQKFIHIIEHYLPTSGAMCVAKTSELTFLQNLQTNLHLL